MPGGGVSGCQGCNGRCCYRYLVQLTGDDAYRIARAQRLGIEQFAVAVPEDEPTSTGFVVTGTDGTWTLALQKRERPGERRACVFLSSLGDGYERCGIYADRPLVCQTYPAALVHGSVAVRDDVLCPSDAWNISGMDLPRWRGGLVRMEVEWAVYSLVVAAWNELAAQRPETAKHPIQYFAWLMRVYARLERLRADGDADELQEICAGWGRPSGAGRWERFVERLAPALQELAA